MQRQPRHTIKTAAALSGLTAHAIRAWERRYTALEPARTDTNRRLYSDEDVRKLALLRKATAIGYTIGRIASLDSDELDRLILQAGHPDRRRGWVYDSPPNMADAATHLEACVASAAEMNGAALEAALVGAETDLGTIAFVDRVAMPLLAEIGEHWRDGTMRTADEHMASSVIRTFLGRGLASCDTAPDAPGIVVTTLLGQIHEFGALAAAVTAATEGWRVTYLGASLPAEEIAGAVRRTGARAIALSIVHPADDPRIPDQVSALRRAVPPETAIFVGGRCASAYDQSLSAAGAVQIANMQALRHALETLRRPQPDVAAAP